MPFIRQTRDKRGFESLYVMHAYRPTPESPHRTRVLYLFRSPAQLKVGRLPLDAEVMEALEHTHPDVSFDWSALTRERQAARTDMQDRATRRSGPPPAPRPVRQAPQDPSVLARVVGAGEAAALRRRHVELKDRVTRRARTPEERDRLLERLGRLNPDGWGDESAVRGARATLQADWSAIAAELPGRRRGRRGGRGRGEGPAPPGPAGGAMVAASAIMEQSEGGHEEEERDSAPVDWPDADSGARGDGGGGAVDVAEPAEDTGLHDDDGTHHD